MTGKDCCICKSRPARSGAPSCSPCDTAARVRIKEVNEHYRTFKNDPKQLTKAIYDSSLKAYLVYNWSKEQLLQDLAKHFSGIDLKLLAEA